MRWQEPARGGFDIFGGDAFDLEVMARAAMQGTIQHAFQDVVVVLGVPESLQLEPVAEALKLLFINGSLESSERLKNPVLHTCRVVAALNLDLEDTRATIGFERGFG